jgi:hypothetical protein
LLLKHERTAPYKKGHSFDSDFGLFLGRNAWPFGKIVVSLCRQLESEEKGINEE